MLVDGFLRGNQSSSSAGIVVEKKRVVVVVAEERKSSLMIVRLPLLQTVFSCGSLKFRQTKRNQR